MTTEEEPCYFLDKLPAELRNRIYRELLQGTTTHHIQTPFDFKEPPLLQVCHQIRNEASSIYYAENSFLFEAENLSTNRCFAWCQRALPRVPSLLSRVRLVHDGSCGYDHEPRSASTENLRRWLFRSHQKLIPAICNRDVICDEFIQNEFEMAEKMSSMPWEAVEQVLDIYERSLSAMKVECTRSSEGEWWMTNRDCWGMVDNWIDN